MAEFEMPYGIRATARIQQDPLAREAGGVEIRDGFRIWYQVHGHINMRTGVHAAAQREGSIAVARQCLYGDNASGFISGIGWGGIL